MGVGLTGKRHNGAFWGGGNVLYLDCGDVYMAVCICQNSLSQEFPGEND